MGNSRHSKHRKAKDVKLPDPYKYDHYTPDPTQHLQTTEDRSQEVKGVPSGRSGVLSTGKNLVRALYDFTSNDAPDFRCVKGDLLELVSDEDGEWLTVLHLKSHTRGMIPATYVASFDSLETCDWYHGAIDRREAERRLLAPGHTHATYLVRASNKGNTANSSHRGKMTSAPSSYALSILYIEQPDNRTIKHYLIKCRDDGGCYIRPDMQFDSVKDLAEGYKYTPQGICCQLGRPCPKGKPVLSDLSCGTRDHWHIDRYTLVFGQMIGKGLYGEVYKGKWHSTDVAIKSMKADKMDPETFLQEATVMKKLRHPKLVSLYAVCSDEQPYYIVTEYMTHGNLRSYLRESPEGRSLKPNNLIDIVVQVSQGMMYIHSNGIVHRDLAARNVLVSENNNVKIGDFGLARVIDSMTSLPEDVKLPIKWTAPEAITSRQFTFKSDVWSFGIIMVEIFTRGQTPYDKLPQAVNSQQLLASLTGGFRHPRPADCPKELYDVMLLCWSPRPDNRPTFEHLADRIENLMDYTAEYQET